MRGRIAHWLEDPLLRALHAEVRAADPIRSISVDLTNVCNIRCAGCYYFAEGMDAHPVVDDVAFARFVESERARGTNFVTVVGGEPSLALDRLRVLYDNFRLSVATNGLRRIPRAGFEALPIGVSVWGGAETDRALRGGGKRDVFAQALRNYRDDERAFFYYTVAPGLDHEVEAVVDACVQNGNRVLFNFYGDVESRCGAPVDFGAVRAAIEVAIERHPASILMTARLAEVITTGRSLGEAWGHATCTSVTFDHPANRERVVNGRPINPHFRSYNADLTTRRCCTGVDRSCEGCFDTWQHFSWVMLDLRRHTTNHADFAHWLTTTWLFYAINRLVEVHDLDDRLVAIHDLLRRCSEELPVASTHPR